MKKMWVLWLLTVLITLAAAVYQRMTGPTYPKKFTVTLNENEYSFKLLRSHGGEEDCPVELEVDDEGISAELVYRRFPTNDEWTTVAFTREDSLLKAKLPHQEPAGKLQYYLVFNDSSGKVKLAADLPVG